MESSAPLPSGIGGMYTIFPVTAKFVSSALTAPTVTGAPRTNCTERARRAMAPRPESCAVKPAIWSSFAATNVSGTRKFTRTCDRRCRFSHATEAATDKIITL